jgi:hypothetical protein
VSDRLTKLARGKECQVRLPGVCNFDSATTVLAHYRMIGVSGMGMKAPSLIGAWACSDCHDAVDRRRYMDLEFDFVRLAHAEGVMRTQVKLIELKAIT